MYIRVVLSGQIADQPPVFVRLCGHPLRWRLLGELARSDRRVQELAALLGQPQNLVSYHLGKLRAAGLVVARRSSFDGRDSHYYLDIARLADMVAEAGTALNPGLRLTPTLVPAPKLGLRVLFLCTGNSARSPLAEALLRRRTDAVDVLSAGSHPKPLHPNTIRVLRGYGVELADRPPRHLSEVADQRFDYVITLCDRVREVCPEFPGQAELIHWSVPDPARAAAGEDTYPAFVSVAAELETRIGFLLASISAASASAPSGRAESH